MPIIIPDFKAKTIPDQIAMFFGTNGSKETKASIEQLVKARDSTADWMRFIGKLNGVTLLDKATQHSFKADLSYLVEPLAKLRDTMLTFSACVSCSPSQKSTGTD